MMATSKIISTIELTHIVDFYFLDAMAAYALSHSAKGGMSSKAEEKWAEDVVEAKDDIAAQLALSFRNYLFVAGVGEARHAEGRCDMWLDEVPNACTRAQACSKAMKFDPMKGLQTLVHVFKQTWHGGAYGGPKWADCMEAATQYHVWPDSVLVDHAVDLEHNGGSVFDKTSSADLVGLNLEFRWLGGNMHTFLNIKRDKDILIYKPSSKYDKDFYQMTATTFGLWHRWWIILQKKEPPPWTKNFANKFTERPNYMGHPPKFGELEFTERIKHYVPQKAQEPTVEYSTPREYATYGDHRARYERGEVPTSSEQKPPDESEEPGRPVQGDEGVPQRQYAYLPT